MENKNRCDDIRELIEDDLIKGSGDSSESIKNHVAVCAGCREYFAHLSGIRGATGIQYKMPDNSRSAFSAMVRTRIEERKSAKRYLRGAAGYVLQTAVMITVVATVIFYLFNTSAENITAGAADELFHYHSYGYELYYYGSDLDHEFIRDMLTDVLMEDNYVGKNLFYPEYPEYSLYYAGDGILSDEEIDYIIQQMNGV